MARSGVLAMRSRCQTLLCVFAVSITCSFPAAGLTAEDFSEALFQKLHKQLQPGDEPWRTIPWKISLLDAQRTAVTENKPIFIWAMDGHPLGCT